jgi:hypothetical protein
MPLFRRKPKAMPPPSVELPSGEEVERAAEATLLHGKSAMKGTLYMTNRRLLFESKTGEARWMVVPFIEVKSAGLYPWPHVPMGRPSSRRQCLVVETTAGEQVWWDFGEEREWLPLVREKARAAAAAGDGD